MVLVESDSKKKDAMKTKDEVGWGGGMGFTEVIR